MLSPLWVGVIVTLAFLCFSFIIPSHSTTVHAATGINHQINFQGKLVNTDGTNVTDGTYTVVFSLYNVSSAGSNLWTETQSVVVSNGIFQVNLGSVTTLPASVDFNTDNIYLGIKVGSDAEMTPRIQFTAVPQAFNSEKLNGLASSAFAQLAANQTFTGTNTFQPTTNISSVKILQNSSGAFGQDVFDVQGSSSGNFIQVTSTAANQGAVTIASLGGSNNLNLNSGSGTVSIGGTTITGTGALTVQSGGATTLTLDAGAAAALNLGTGNANAVSISKTGVTTTVNGALAVTQGTTLTGALTLNNTGYVNTNSTSAFKVENSGGNTNVLVADTTNGRVGINKSNPNVALDIGGSTAAGTVSTQSLFQLTRSITGGVSYPQVATFNLGSYAVNGAGNGFGPSTRLDINLKSTNTNTEIADATVLTLQSNGQVGVSGTPVNGNGILTVGTNTTAASGGIYLGSDTNFYRNAASTLMTDSSLQVNGTAGVGQYQNYITNSETIGGTGWTINGSYAPVVNSTAAPDGNTTATKLLQNGITSNSFTQQIFTANSTTSPYTASIWAKSGNVSQVQFGIYDYSASAWVNFTTLTTTTNWQRFSVTGTPVATGHTLAMIVYQNSSGDVTAGDYIYVWGAQLVDGSAPLVYNRTSGTANLTLQDGVVSNGSVFQAASNATNYFAGNVGIGMLGATTALQLGSNAGTGASGLSFGSAGDTNLYRSAAGILKTDGVLSVGKASTTTGGIIFNGSGGVGTLTVAGPTTPNAGNFTLSIPAITGNANICTDNSICAGYAASSGGNYIAKNTNDTSSASYLGNLLGLTNTNTGAAGVLALTNNGTNSALNILQSGTSEPAAGQALILANNNTTTPSGNLLDLQNKGTSKFSVDVNGNVQNVSETINGGNLTFSGTTARTITGPSTGGLTETVASGPLTLSTTTSGILAVTSAGALNLTGAAASSFGFGANTLAITSSNLNVTAAGAVTAGTYNGDTLTSTALTFSGASPVIGASTAGTGLTLQANGSGTLLLNTTGAGTVNVGTANSTTIGIGNTSAAVSIEGSNAGAIAIGNGATAHTINIGAGSGANNTTVAVGSGVTGASNTANITIGSANAAASTLLLQGGNGASAVSVQAAASGTISVGTTNNNAITIGGTGTTNQITIGQANGSNSNTISIGSNIGASGTQTINIGNSSTASSTTNLVLGSTVAGSITLQSAGGVVVSTLGSGTGAYLCRNGSNQLSTCNTTGNGTAFVQGGNSLGALAVLGTTDANSLSIGTYNGTALQQRIGITNTIAAGNNSALTFAGTSLFKPTTDSATAFQIQPAGSVNAVFNVDTTNSQLAVRGINSDAVMSANNSLTGSAGAVTNFSAGWTGTGWTLGASSATHTAGITGLTKTGFTPTIGATYLITYIFNTGNSDGINTVTPSLGGVNGAVNYQSSGTYTDLVTATTTGGLFFTPTTGWTGVITSVNVQQITSQANSVLSVLNSGGNARLEVRATTPASNTLLGLGAGQFNTTGTNNTALGQLALGSNTSGSQNLAIGDNALSKNTTSSFNLAIGSGALQNNTAGTLNLGIGYLALNTNTTGYNNLGLGTYALQLNTTGGSNVALGVNSLTGNTDGDNNIGIGGSTLQLNVHGSENIAIGSNSLYNSSGGYYNTAIGYNALKSSTSHYNTAIGASAGETSVPGNAHTGGDANTFIGYQSGPGVASAYSLQNATAIGMDSVVNASNTLTLGCISGVNGCAATTKVGISSGGYANNALTVAAGTSSAGTISQTASTAVIGTSTAFTPGMVGGTIYYSDGTSDTIATYTDATHITTTSSHTKSGIYTIVWGGTNVTSTGAVSLQNTANSTTAFQVQPAGSANAIFNVDTSNSLVSVRGANSDAVLGSELMLSTTNFSSNWTNASGTKWTFTAPSAAHATGLTAAAVYSGFTPTAGAYYQVTYTFSGASGNGTDTITPSIGGTNGVTQYDTGATVSDVILANTTGSLQFIPSTNWNGSITSVSVKLITTSNAALRVLNSAGNPSLEVRTSSSQVNQFVGVNAGLSNSTGNWLTAFGYQSLSHNTSGIGNAAFGDFTLSYNTTGNNNSAFGDGVLQANTVGHDNSGFGGSVLNLNTTGNYNAAFGSNVLRNNTIGSNNSAIGTYALNANTTGSANTATGFSSLQLNTTGTNNTASGNYALYHNISGTYNTALGDSALYTNLGAGNTAVGSNSLELNSSGINNVAVGNNAGYTNNSANANTTGSYNTFLGYNSGQGVASSTSLSAATAIGAASTVNYSATLTLGCTAGVNGCGTSTNVGIASGGYANNALTIGASTSSAGTISQTASTAIVGTTTAFTSGMVGGTIYYNDLTTDTIATFTDATHITTAGSHTESGTYTIVWAGTNLTSTGKVSLQNTSNTTTAFQIQNASGTTLLNSDTTNMRISVGSGGTATGQLYVPGMLPSAPLSTASVGGSGQAHDLAVNGRYMYTINFNTTTLYVFDVSNPSSPTQVASLATLGGSPESMTFSGHYVYIAEYSTGSGNKMEIVDVSKPSAPVVVGSVITTNTPEAITISGRYAYVGTDTGVDVMDISNPAVPIKTTNVSIGAVGKAYSVFSAGRYVYATTPNDTTTAAYLKVIDTSTNTLVGTFNLSGGTSGNVMCAGNNTPRSVYVQGRYAFVANCGNNAIDVFDVKDPTAGGAPVKTLSTTGIAANVGPAALTVQGRYLYAALNTSGTTPSYIAAYDITTISSMSMVGSALTISNTGQKPSGIAASGRYLYIANLSSQNVEIFDLGGTYSQQLEVGSTETATLQVGNDASVAGNTSISGGLQVGQSAQVSGNLGVNGQAVFANSSNSTTAFQVQNAAGTQVLNVDTSNSLVSVRGKNSDAVIGPAELMLSTTNFSSNWSGLHWTFGAANAIHSAGAGFTAPAVYAGFTPSSGNNYQVTFTYTGASGNGTDAITPSIGGTNGQTIYDSSATAHTQIIHASSSGSLQFTPTANWAGTITSVSVKLVTNSNPVLQVLNSGGSARLEIRASTDYNNNFIGVNAGQSITTGNYNTALGVESLANTTTGNSNASFGTYTLTKNTTGFNNSAFGDSALLANTTGADNTSIGANSSINNTTGYSNTAVGSTALHNNTNGNQNVAVGYNSLYSNTIGYNNTAIGLNSLTSNTTGFDNTALGLNSGYTTNSANANTTGSYNTFIGHQSGPGVASAISLQAASAFGAYAVVNANNTLALGCTSGVNSCASTTKVGISSGGYANNALTVAAGTSSAGTISQTASTAIIGTSTAFTSGMVGGTIYYSDGTSDNIATYTDATHITTTGSHTESGTYTIVWGGMNVTSSGAVSLQNTADSTAAFKIQNALSTTTLFNADTTNSTITIAGNTTTFALLTLTNAHFKSTQTTAPTIGTPTNCGTTPTAAVAANSTDSAGSFRITAGNPTGTTCDTVLSFNKSYGAAPKSIIVVAETKDGGTGTAAARQIYVSASAVGTFTVKMNSAPLAAEVDWFYYWVVE